MFIMSSTDRANEDSGVGVDSVTDWLHLISTQTEQKRRPVMFGERHIA